MRISSALLFALAACGGEERRGDQTAIPCAIDSDEFSDDCIVERAVHPNGAVLTIRHADGGFRRLVTTSDGRGVASADGAEEASVKLIADNMIEVRIGNARYRLPATVKGAK